MKKTRKYLAFILAMCLMMSSMTVFAAETGSSTADSSTTDSTTDDSATEDTEEDVIGYYWSYSNGIVVEYVDDPYTWYFYGDMPGDSDAVYKGDYWYDYVNGSWKQWDGKLWMNDEIHRAIKERAEAEALQAEAEAEGFTDAAQMQYAREAHKNAGEYYNNAVVKTPGIEEATPVAQGGKLVIDGKVTNATATISKVTSAYVDSVRAAQEGRVLNVVDVDFPAVEATINFYMPSVREGMDIVALQYVDGAWTNVEVAEVRTDHVVLNMKGTGVVAFVAK